MAIKAGDPADFTINVLPAFDSLVELLGRDHAGAYRIPFPCRLRVDGWFNDGTGEKLETQVIGWRPWQNRQGKARSRPEACGTPESNSGGDRQ